MAVAPEILNHLVSLERKLLSLEFRSSSSFGDLLAEDFLEIGASGRVYGKADAVRTASRTSIVTPEIESVAGKTLSPELFLITYLLKVPSQTPEDGRQSMRTSLWRSEGGQWKIVFHQGTPLAPGS